jgi:hypothetical protein
MKSTILTLVHVEGKGAGGDFACGMFMCWLICGLVAGIGFSLSTCKVVVTRDGIITSVSYTDIMDKNENLFRIYDIILDNMTMITIKDSVSIGLQYVENRGIGDHVYVYHVESDPPFSRTSDYVGSESSVKSEREFQKTFDAIACEFGWIFFCFPIIIMILRLILWVHDAFKIIKEFINDKEMEYLGLKP